MESLKKYVKSSEAIVVFVILELLGLMCFGLGGSNIIFFVVGLIVNIATIPFMVINSNKQELKHFALFALPLVLMALLICFGNMYKTPGLFINNLFSFFGIVSFLMIGYSARRIKSFKMENGLIIIGGALALIALISMFITWFNYGLFYATKYEATPIYYYNGELFDVTKESSWLLGFSLSEVSLAYSGIFGFLSTLFLIGLLFINPKENIKKFLIYLVIGLVGLVALVTVPNKEALMLLIPGAIIGVCFRFIPRTERTKKVTSILFYLVVVIVVICLLVAILNNYIPKVANIIASNTFLRKAFNGRIMNKTNEVIKVIFKSGYFFGVKPTLLNGSILTANTKMFEAEIMKEGGFLALVTFMVFMVFAFMSLREYNSKSKDSKLVKTMIISLVFGLFIYSSLNYDAFYVVHSSEVYYPFFRSLPALVMICLLGYSFYPHFGKEVELYMDSEEFARGVELAPEAPKQTNKDKDYNFDEEDDLDE